MPVGPLRRLLAGAASEAVPTIRRENNYFHICHNPRKTNRPSNAPPPFELSHSASQLGSLPLWVSSSAVPVTGLESSPGSPLVLPLCSGPARESGNLPQNVCPPRFPDMRGSTPVTMPNHFHLVIGPPCQLCQPRGRGEMIPRHLYTSGFNRRHKLFGHLLQSRFQIFISSTARPT